MQELNQCLLPWQKDSLPPAPPGKHNESESHSIVSDSWQTLELYSPWNSPGQNTRMGSHSLLQGIFPTLGSNPGLPHCRQIVYQLSQGRTGGQYNISRIKNWIYNLIKHLKNVFSFKAENKTLSTLCVPPPLLYLEKHLGMNCSSPSNQIMHTNNIIYSWVRRKGRTFYLLSISQYVKKQNKTQLFNIFSFSTKML